jgi:formylglycine-generating enzyme required for sulfatase activity/cellulose biosynthesis protein BcsQ
MPVPPRGKIVTFYSYKGGTGRSMALANVAWILASAGKRVLMLDWDLEAPGLHRYFAPFLVDPDLEATEGIIDFVREFALEVKTPGGATEAGDGLGRFTEITRYAVGIDWDFPGEGALDLVPAGRQDSDYAARVNLFNWSHFYQHLGGGSFWEEVKRVVRDKYDYVLIDSRTGVSDTAGICTVQLPDVLIVCFTLNRQNIEGAAAVAASVREQRDRTGLQILPVPMRVELGEKVKLDRSREYAHGRFAGFLDDLPEDRREGYWSDVEIVYYQYYAYEEILATFGDRPGSSISILASLERLTGYLSGGEIDRLAAPSEFDRQAVLVRYSLRPGSDTPAESALRLRPTLRCLYDESLEAANRWSIAEYDDTQLVDARLLSQLVREPHVLSLLMQGAVFPRFFSKSVAAVRHKNREAQLVTLIAKLSKHQLESLLGQVNIRASDLGGLVTPTAETAEEIVRLVDQRGRGEFDELEKIAREIIVSAIGNQARPGLPGPDALQAEGIRVVPKGLRAFDLSDADFFLELLPGPRDSEGVPEILRFWKTRIESTDPDTTFTVGLIYGPSGCGKSSMVKAGLLPRLGRDVLTVYIEATARETEARLLRSLRRLWPGLPAELTLVDSLAALRQGLILRPGQKVLLVLDQFEQWLFARRGELDSELVAALRQCDGARVQAIVIVRDDFWMATTRFMRDLEVPFVEGANTAAVDLFDPLHARRVLTAYGRAYGVLPENADEVTPEQRAFLEHSVTGLVEQDGRVIPIRLALFAEMVKGRPWTLTTLRDLGGISGVGMMFLEETFGATTASPSYRLHQRAAQAILKALLPAEGMYIRGQMRSEQELREAAGYAGRPRDFDEVISILDQGLRLITPTDIEVTNTEGPEQPLPEARYYQLTHDYLVPSIHEWVTRKQRETRRGRAGLLLTERAAMWNSKRENRYLPSVLEWVRIAQLTNERDWTEAQRMMMHRAGRVHGLRALGLAITAAFLGVMAFQLRNRIDEGRKAATAENLVQRLLIADITQVPALLQEMDHYRLWTDPELRRIVADPSHDPGTKLHASLALARVDPTQSAYVEERLLDAGPTELPVLRTALEPFRQRVVPKFWAVLDSARTDDARVLPVAGALASYDPRNPLWADVGDKVAGALVTANSIYLKDWLDDLREARARLNPHLARIFRDPTRSAAVHSQAASILADYASDDPSLLADLIMDADTEAFARLFLVAARLAHAMTPIFQAELRKTAPAGGEEAMDALAQRQARGAVALLRLGHADLLWPLLKYGPDPRLRSFLVNWLSPLGADPRPLVAELDRLNPLATRTMDAILFHPETSQRRALLLALGTYQADGLTPEERAPLIPRLLDLYERDPDAGIHGAAEWVLRRWTQQPKLRAIDARLKRQDRGDRRWYVGSQGQTFVIVEGPVEFRMGSPAGEPERYDNEETHFQKLAHRFAIAAREVTVAQYQEFLDQNPKITPLPVDRYSPEPTGPMTAMTWYEAAAFCNWLSKREGLPKDEWCYLLNDQGEYARGMRIPAAFLRRTGYRLPTEAEWEYACRAGSVTSRYYGNAKGLLNHYAWYIANSGDPGQAHACGELLPNELGLFDMLGNVSEWCQDRYNVQHGDNQQLIEDILDDSPRLFRGGSFVNRPEYLRSASRSWSGPTQRTVSNGLRLARTQN